VTYGVRWEYNRPATEVSETPYVPDKAVDGSQGTVTFVKASSWWKRSNANAFAPRLGMSWSPGDQSKFIIHAGYGLAFDSIPTYASAAAANSVPGLAYSCTATTYGVASTAGCGTVPANTRLSQSFPQQLPAPSVLPSSFLTPPLQLLGSAPNSVLFDPNFKTATVQQWNLTIQRELPGGFVFQTGYVGNRGERLYSQTDLNQVSATPILSSFAAMQSNLSKGCKPDGTGCPNGAASTPIPLVASEF
jgi:hypothetical protein